MKHTPGPWEITAGFVVGPASNVIAKILQQKSPSVTLANAHLIKAAPDLLENLRQLCELLESIGHDCTPSRAAIAKATGGTL